jgi:hypothetical protein
MLNIMIYWSKFCKMSLPKKIYETKRESKRGLGRDKTNKKAPQTLRLGGFEHPLEPQLRR